jgi:pentatricopeptide repeat protein
MLRAVVNRSNASASLTTTTTRCLVPFTSIAAVSSASPSSSSPWALAHQWHGHGHVHVVGVCVRYLRTKSARKRIRFEEEAKKQLAPFGIEEATTRIPLTLAPPATTDVIVRLRVEMRKKIAFAITPTRLRTRDAFIYVRNFWRKNRQHMSIREWNALIEYYAARRALPLIDDALVDMSNDGIPPNATSFAHAIDAYCRMGRLYACRSLLERMSEQHVTRDVRVYEHVFMLLHRRFNTQLAIEAAKTLASASANVLGTGTTTPTPTLAIARAVNKGDAKEEEPLNNNDDEKDIKENQSLSSTEVPSTPSTLTSELSSSSESLYDNVRYEVVSEEEVSPYEEMVSLYHQMLDDKLQPSITIFSSILQAAISRNDKVVIKELITGMLPYHSYATL